MERRHCTDYRKSGFPVLVGLDLIDDSAAEQTSPQKESITINPIMSTLLVTLSSKKGPSRYRLVFMYKPRVPLEHEILGQCRELTYFDKYIRDLQTCCRCVKLYDI